MKSFKKIQIELRELFRTKGWMYEIEGKSVPYYNIYTSILEFIYSEFYLNNNRVKDVSKKKRILKRINKEKSKIRKET